MIYTQKHLNKAFTNKTLGFFLRPKKTLTVKGNLQKYPSREKSRRKYILPKHIGRVFFVHNGKTFISVHIQKKMLGHKFGEFAITRQKPVHKKKKKINSSTNVYMFCLIFYMPATRGGLKSGTAGLW